MEVECNARGWHDCLSRTHLRRRPLRHCALQLILVNEIVAAVAAAEEEVRNTQLLACWQAGGKAREAVGEGVEEQAGRQAPISQRYAWHLGCSHQTIDTRHQPTQQYATYATPPTHLTAPAWHAAAKSRGREPALCLAPPSPQALLGCGAA